jgi:hypothetical protein
MAPLTCPVCAAPVRQGDLICTNCGANLARREPPPQQQYPSQPDQQPGAYQSQDYQSPEQSYPPQQPYPPQQDQAYQPPQDQQQPYPQQQQQPPQYPPQQQDYQQQRYSQPQGHTPYPPPPEQPYSQPDQQRQPYPPQQDQQQYAPPQQDRQQYAPQQQYPQQPPQQQPQYPAQQQGYGGGYGSTAPHVPPPPREPTMTGGESTAAFTPFCPHCGAEIPDVGNPVCVQCLRPLHDQGGGGAGAQQVSLFVQFSSGELQVSAGQELMLGRDPVQSPVASAFTRFDNVSRRHATLGIDGSGQAWIRDERSTNGTFVNDRRLQPGEQTPLRDGDSLRLAADARGQVRVGR